jgi:hypothetical protein
VVVYRGWSRHIEYIPVDEDGRVTHGPRLDCDDVSAVQCCAFIGAAGHIGHVHACDGVCDVRCGSRKRQLAVPCVGAEL